MTARFLPLICLFACRSEPSGPPPKTADLAVPPMPDAGARPAPTSRTATVVEHETSYEEALTAAAEAPPMVVDETDMTDAELAAPMRLATWVAGCGAPSEMKLTVKVAVQRGRAVGVTVHTDPPDRDIARCVDEHVRRELHWPVKQKMDTFTVTY